jgi:hypothetical protein
MQDAIAISCRRIANDIADCTPMESMIQGYGYDF